MRKHDMLELEQSRKLHNIKRERERKKKKKEGNSIQRSEPSKKYVQSTIS